MTDPGHQRDDWPIFLRKLSSLRIREAISEARIALLPVGSIEQHGDHLPIDTDLTIVEYLAEEGLKAARLETGKLIGFIAPSIPYGGPEMGMHEWAGTLSLQPATLIDLLVSVAAGLYKSGFPYVVLMNGCVGNIPALSLAVQRLKSKIPDGNFIFVDGFWTNRDVIEAVRESEPGGSGHAGEIETSLMLALEPNRVSMKDARQGELQHPSSSISFDLTQSNTFFWPVSFGELTKNGVLGDPSTASSEKGGRILEVNVQHLKSILCHLDSLYATG
jgi:creatinine amidohydrolase